jgi:hypothetical protein
MSAVQLTSAPKSEGAVVEMIDLFSIDGVMYQMPAKPRVNIALQYLNDARTVGPEAAQMMLLEKMLGEKGYKALSEYDDLTADNLTEIMAVVQKHTMGALENAGGNSESGSEKSAG